PLGRPRTHPRPPGDRTPRRLHRPHARLTHARLRRTRRHGRRSTTHARPPRHHHLQSESGPPTDPPRHRRGTRTARSTRRRHRPVRRRQPRLDSRRIRRRDEGNRRTRTPLRRRTAPGRRRTRPPMARIPTRRPLQRRRISRHPSRRHPRDPGRIRHRHQHQSRPDRLHHIPTSTPPGRRTRPGSGDGKPNRRTNRFTVHRRVRISIPTHLPQGRRTVQLPRHERRPAHRTTTHPKRRTHHPPRTRHRRRHRPRQAPPLPAGHLKTNPRGIKEDPMTTTPHAPAPPAAESGANATQRFNTDKSTHPVNTPKERVDLLAREVLDAVHNTIRKHKVTYDEYNALKAWLISVGETGEWPLFLDVWVEHVVE